MEFGFNYMQLVTTHSVIIAARRHACACAVVVCLSVCVSVCLSQVGETAKRWIMQKRHRTAQGL